MPNEHRIRVAAVVRNDRNEILCVKHFNRGDPFWTLPGGAPEGQELPEAALAREVIEETGWSVAPNGILAVGVLHVDRWESPKVELVFDARPLAYDQPVQRVGESILEAQFFSLENIPASFRPRELLEILTTRSTVPYITFAVDTI